MIHTSRYVTDYVTRAAEQAASEGRDARAGLALHAADGGLDLLAMLVRDVHFAAGREQLFRDVAARVRSGYDDEREGLIAWLRAAEADYLKSDHRSDDFKRGVSSVRAELLNAGHI